MNPVIIEKEEIARLLDFKEIISVIERSFIDFSFGKSIMPPPHDIILKEFYGETHVKSAYIKGDDFYCIKIASGFYNNPKLGLSSSQGLMILLNAKTGVPKCILLEEGMLTDYRTAAAGGIAAKYLAKPDSKSILVIGTGIQARLQVKFLMQIFQINQVFVWGRNHKNVQSYRDYFSKLKFLNVYILNSVKECKKVDIIITATSSRIPLVYNIEKGAHINAIGADLPGKQELDSKLLAKAKIVTDSTEQCKKNGELQHVPSSSHSNLNFIHAELGEVIAKVKRGRESSEEITIFDSTGLGVQDLAIAKYIFNKFIDKNYNSNL